MKIIVLMAFGITPFTISLSQKLSLLDDPIEELLLLPEPEVSDVVLSESEEFVELSELLEEDEVFC